MQIKAPQHLHQPLVHQRFRHHNQHPLRAFGEQLMVQNQTRLDSLAQTHLIGQQHPRRIAVGHLMGDIQLMRNQAGAAAGQAIQLGMRQPVAVLQGLITQLKPLIAINLAIEQTLRRTIQLQEIIQLPLLNFSQRTGLIPADVSEQAINLTNLAHTHLPAIMAGDGIAHLKRHAGEGRRLLGISTGFTGSQKQHRQSAKFNRQHRAQPHFKLSITNTTLTR
jgi:hypothetical protein